MFMMIYCVTKFFKLLRDLRLQKIEIYNPPIMTCLKTKQPVRWILAYSFKGLESNS